VHDRDVEPALRGPDVGEVGQPLLVRTLGLEVRAAISARSARCWPLPGNAVAGAAFAPRIQRRSTLSASSRSRHAWATVTPRSVTSFTASSLNSRLNFRGVISTLQFHGHNLIFVSTKPAAALARHEHVPWRGTSGRRAPSPPSAPPSPKKGQPRSPFVFQTVHHAPKPRSMGLNPKTETASLHWGRSPAAFLITSKQGSSLDFSSPDALNVHRE
jgi:hypothetical protein